MEGIDLNGNGVELAQKIENGTNGIENATNGLEHKKLNGTSKVNGINENGIAKSNGILEHEINDDENRVQNGNANGKESADGERKGFCAGFMMFRIIGTTRIEYLLLKASNMKNHWTPPKGHIEQGETAFDAAIRETEEEARLAPGDYDVIPGFFAKVQYEGTHGLKYVSYWPARLKNTDHVIEISDEHLAYKWCDIDVLAEICTRESTTRAYQDLDKFIRANCLIQGGSDGN